MKTRAMTSWNRRDFTKTLILAGTTTALGAARAANANTRVRLGFIGVGNRGDQVLDAFLKQPDTEVAAICDLLASIHGFCRKKGRQLTTPVQRLPSTSRAKGH